MQRKQAGWEKARSMAKRKNPKRLSLAGDDLSVEQLYEMMLNENGHAEFMRQLSDTKRNQLSEYIAQRENVQNDKDMTDIIDEVQVIAVVFTYSQ
jgi:hypothetical protein